MGLSMSSLDFAVYTTLYARTTLTCPSFVFLQGRKIKKRPALKKKKKKNICKTYIDMTVHPYSGTWLGETKTSLDFAAYASLYPLTPLKPLIPPRWQTLKTPRLRIL